MLFRSIYHLQTIKVNHYLTSFLGYCYCATSAYVTTTGYYCYFIYCSTYFSDYTVPSHLITYANSNNLLNVHYHATVTANLTTAMFLQHELTDYPLNLLNSFLYYSVTSPQNQNTPTQGDDVSVICDGILITCAIARWGCSNRLIVIRRAKRAYRCPPVHWE